MSNQSPMLIAIDILKTEGFKPVFIDWLRITHKSLWVKTLERAETILRERQLEVA